MIRGAIRATLATEETEETMKSRAKLLAELEQKRIENNKIQNNLNMYSISDPESESGYDPYNHPGLCKEIPDGVDITARRRQIALRYRRS